MITKFAQPDWAALFAVNTPLAELGARATVLYVVILVLMRVMPRRTGGELATIDLIFLLLIAGAASNAFGEYKSVTEGLLLIGVLVIWDYVLNAASYRFRFIERLVSAPPIPVVRDGKLLRRNMRREFLTEEELMSSLRQQEITNLEEVKIAYIEAEGAITVVRRR
ncbi:DUF421 domain-containing protein [Massilia consociata]|uniref:DUF421 domain-containing protein n=1 Tax=Massilia consociata TaxID=760117 RepID=A0ABV6FAI1_9BURK